jgi:hypothetical protein
LAQESKGETAPIAEEAFIYGFPMVMNYAVFYEYFIDKSAPGYKAPLNTLYNSANVYTSADTTIVMPNSDTPYSFVGMDLRAEPFVICNPEIEKSRYFSVQLVDFYTFNFGYMGSRTTGNGANCGMIAGPGWKPHTIQPRSLALSLASFQAPVKNSAEVMGMCGSSLSVMSFANSPGEFFRLK